MPDNDRLGSVWIVLPTVQVSSIPGRTNDENYNEISSMPGYEGSTPAFVSALKGGHSFVALVCGLVQPGQQPAADECSAGLSSSHDRLCCDRLRSWR